MRTIGAARELLPYGSDKTDRERWLEMRRAGITASEISTILGLNKWNSPLSLYYDKIGAGAEPQDSYRMQLGAALEPYVLSCCQRISDCQLDYYGLLASGERPWQLATPDAVLAGTSIPVEAKTSLSEDEWGPAGSDQIPLYYRCQLLWQMDVLGAREGCLCVVFLRSGEPRCYQLGWDGEDIAVLREAGEAFLQSAEDGIPPPPDGSEATTAALRHRYSPAQDTTAGCSRMLVRRYRAALRRSREAEANLDLIKNMVRYEMGFASRLTDPDGATVATRRGKNDALYPARGL